MTTVKDDLGSYASADIQRCPFPFLKRLLKEAPVYRDPGTGMYIVSRYDDINFVNSHPEIFSSRTPMMINRKTSVSEEVKRRYAERGWPEEFVLAFADPPEHSLHRALVDKVFTPSYVKRLEPTALGIVDTLIDGFIESGETNLGAGFAVHLPMYIICDQLGVAREDYEKFKVWSTAWLDRNDPNCPPDRELMLTDRMIDMQNYLATRAREYEENPGDNLLSRLVHAEVEGERLTMGQLLMIAQLLLVAGNETTTTGITTSMYMLLSDPALMDRVLTDPALIPLVIEEMLRAHAPVPHQYRFTTQDTELCGVPIPKDTVVQVSYLAGNYDEAKWECPEKIDIDRKGVRNHLAFGRGIHFCVGNQLARMEMRVAVTRLLHRLKDLRLSEKHPQPQFMEHFQIHAIDSLHVSFTPDARLS
ncbi:Putative cytochrome P450 YjiB [Pseudomonas fluorescens]|uniref:Cytochrome P450 YjiB n=1 Tax=Pseudomonas fluorescens TaxID=294 RepID=A0A8H2NNX5_PSEFL|nr:cytochrome P450 [Pseudomonas fluorescens]VVO58603.1 Putative cytochrome P450 YjiB [Pseudomonas fluorescens]